MSSNTITVADEALLVAYLDGDLSLKDAAALEERLTTNPALAAALRSLTAADQLGRKLAGRGLAPAVAPLTAPTGRRWPTWIIAGLAAVAAAAAAVWLLSR